ncbi:MAG: HypC/HybG/HupF family hydrogenase formation chaperone [Lachnospiraceae bacterium]|nr:HypC/HybG/HupF family hydrogenase formation chaperone [Lachnospiraceae bacterium]
MCVALPGLVKEVRDDAVIVDFSGNEVTAMPGLVPVKKGDRVLVHAGCILQVMSDKEADELEAIFSEVGAF